MVARCSMALTHKFSRQLGAVFLELWLTREKENASFSEAILFARPAEMAKVPAPFLPDHFSSVWQT
jgi:hypothetical protein